MTRKGDSVQRTLRLPAFVSCPALRQGRSSLVSSSCRWWATPRRVDLSRVFCFGCSSVRVSLRSACTNWINPRHEARDSAPPRTRSYRCAAGRLARRTVCAATVSAQVAQDIIPSGVLAYGYGECRTADLPCYSARSVACRGAGSAGEQGYRATVGVSFQSGLLMNFRVTRPCACNSRGAE
jgi:hypothetical protein